MHLVFRVLLLTYTYSFVATRFPLLGVRGPTRRGAGALGSKAEGAQGRTVERRKATPMDLLEAFFFSLLILVIELKTKQM